MKIKWFPQRAIVALILAVIIVLFVGAVALLGRASTTQATISWGGQTTLFTAQERDAIMAQLQAALNQGQTGGVYFTINSAQRVGDMAVLGASESLDRSGPPLATEPLTILARKQGDTWLVWVPGSSGFCDQVRQAPDQLLTPAEKRQFAGCFS